ncbi:MAG TPA: hypothetical protein VMB50_01550 [Myxococcales bacterium]|nr:hypothetical protein [Myxococcales bacterium]
MTHAKAGVALFGWLSLVACTGAAGMSGSSTGLPGNSGNGTSGGASAAGGSATGSTAGSASGGVHGSSSGATSGTSSGGTAGASGTASGGTAGSNGTSTGGNSGGAACTIDDGGVVVVDAGSATVLSQGGLCDAGAGVAGVAQCTTLDVSCPGLPDMQATIADLEPPVGTPLAGTIVTHTGGSGKGFFSDGPAGEGFDRLYPQAGFRYVQLSWSGDWASTGTGIKAAACRPATAFQWIFENVHGGSHALPFCGTGSSGGAAAFLYALTTYGLKADFDYLVLAAGPTPARMDYGCDPSLYQGSGPSLCPGQPAALDPAPFSYSGSQYGYTYGAVDSVADGWEGGTGCGQNPTAQQLAEYAGDQLLSPGDDLCYPQTGISWWFCASAPGSAPNESTGQATFFIDEVQPAAPPDVHCYAGDGGTHGVCYEEYVFQDPGARAAAAAEMEAKCVPRH